MKLTTFVILVVIQGFVIDEAAASGSAMSTIICEHQTKTIQCPSGYEIDILSANYGRTDAGTCPSSSITDLNCGAATSLSIVQGLCDGNQSCSLTASNGVFGDPCPGTFKYLEVQYRCNCVTK